MVLQEFEFPQAPRKGAAAPAFAVGDGAFCELLPDLAAFGDGARAEIPPGLAAFVVDALGVVVARRGSAERVLPHEDGRAVRGRLAFDGLFERAGIAVRGRALLAFERGGMVRHRRGAGRIGGGDGLAVLGAHEERLARKRARLRAQVSERARKPVQSCKR